LQVNNTTPKKNKKKKVYVLLMYLVAYTLDDTDSPTVIMQDVHVILSPVPLPQVFWVLGMYIGLMLNLHGMYVYEIYAGLA
jgi:hypothetical protein